MSRHRTTARAAAVATARVWPVVAATSLACSTVAVAHEGDPAGLHHGWPPLALFAFGIVVLAGSVYLDATDAVARRHADVGVALGVLAVVASIPLYWL